MHASSSVHRDFTIPYLYIYIYIEASIDGRQLIPRRGTIILSACVSSSHTLTPSLFLRTKFSFSRPDFHHYDQIPFSPSPSCYHFPPSLFFGSLVREEEIFNNIYSTIRSTREDKFSSREKCLAYQSNFFPRSKYYPLYNVTGKEVRKIRARLCNRDDA